MFTGLHRPRASMPGRSPVVDVVSRRVVDGLSRPELVSLVRLHASDQLGLDGQAGRLWHIRNFGPQELCRPSPSCHRSCHQKSSKRGPPPAPSICDRQQPAAPDRPAGRGSSCRGCQLLRHAAHCRRGQRVKDHAERLKLESHQSGSLGKVTSALLRRQARAVCQSVSWDQAKIEPGTVQPGRDAPQFGTRPRPSHHLCVLRLPRLLVQLEPSLEAS